MTQQALERTVPAAEEPVIRTHRRRIHGLPFLLCYGAVLLLFVVAGLFAPVLAPHDPNQQALTSRLHPPVWQSGGSSDHLLGTDNLGRDVLSRLIYGARISLLVVAVSIPLSMVFGTMLGLLAGYRGGLIDLLLMRAVDIQPAMPALLFAVLLAAVYGPSLRNVLIIIVVWRWAPFARLVRGEVLSLRGRDFVLASHALGAGDRWIMLRHLVPNLINPVVILATLDLAAVILIEASLSFLGVGVPPPTASWGSMVSDGRNYLRIASWMVAVPGLAILLVSLVANLFGDWLRDALDPRLRNVR
jgi:peptide/nickel transport system permease protein